MSIWLLSSRNTRLFIVMERVIIFFMELTNLEIDIMLLRISMMVAMGKR